MLLSQGLELMLYGMGTVVLFLSLLVFATRGMSAAVLRFFPQPVTPAPVAKPPAADDSGEAPTPEMLAAITIAIHRHQQHQRRQQNGRR